jgi:polysaccharide export outer membrane protein
MLAAALSAIVLGLSGCGNAAPVASASDLTRDEQYLLAPGDKLHVIVFGEETLTGDYVLTSAGNLSFPLVGNIRATDRTVEQLQADLARALGDGYINDPRVSIQVVSFRPFYILGEVSRPGEYPVSTGLTIQQAVASAGGYTYRANTKRIFLKRAGETQERIVDLRRQPNLIVRAGDTIRISERHF